MTDDSQDKSAGSRIVGALLEIRGILIVAGVLILLLIVGGAFITNPIAQILTGVLTAIITTLVSIYATYHSASISSQKTAKDELTRYGLLAWRNLDSLQLKVTQHVGENATVTRDLLREWLLDIDQAKWAWQDILREVFVLQERLQVETYELAQDYKEKMRKAQPEDRPKLEAAHQVELARLVSSSPLPLRIPTDVKCPNCASAVTAQLGSNTGDTHTVRCDACGRMFHVHRRADGAVLTKKYGAASAGANRAQSKERALGATLDAVQEIGLNLVRDVFASAPDEILIGGWDEFFEKVGVRVVQEGLEAADASVIRNFLYSRKAFRLLGPGNGIGLVVPASQLAEYVIGAATARSQAQAAHGGNADVPMPGGIGTSIPPS